MRLATSVPVGEQRRAVDFIVKLSIGIKRERGGKGSQAPEPERFLKPHLSLILNWQWAKRPFVLFGRRAHLILLVVTETRRADRPCTGATGTGVLRRPAREFSEISLQPLPAVAIHFDEAGHPLTKTSPLHSRKGRDAPAIHAGVATAAALRSEGSTSDRANFFCLDALSFESDEKAMPTRSAMPTQSDTEQAVFELHHRRDPADRWRLLNP
ncbi:hypothetical protein [Mesorhizobium sp.]|uniref:hypothetical protein n=1 Tax=Mesorhizobium sp. TaxID=1871066 RepID=UPI0025D68CD9|nr:hypothetical protein [Mesorhizobium sp.]